MILVTGAYGFIGQTLIPALTTHGETVRPYEGSINRPSHLRDQLTNINTIIHLASAETHGRQRQLQHVDLDGSARLLEEAKNANINHIIYLSRLGADPNSMYALFRIKGQVERMVIESGLPYTIVRSGTIYGRGDHFLTRILLLAHRTWPFVWLPDHGRSLLQPIWVEDLIRCLIAISDPLDLHGHRNQQYQLGGEERLNYNTIVNMVLATAKLPRRPLPMRMMFSRILNTLLFSWRQTRQPLTRFFLDRLAVPETAPLDSILRTFNFRPSHLNQHLSFLRQPSLTKRILRYP